MIKNRLSIVIPARNELFMPETVNDIFSKATGDIEVIVVLDGYWPEVMPKDHVKLTYIHSTEAKGLRPSTMMSAVIARGEFLMKCDAHCMFALGFDEVIKADFEDNWVVVPRRHSLDPENWCIQQNGKAGRDAHYLCYPDKNKGEDHGMHGVEWSARWNERKDYLIDDEMSSQGSCWTMKKTWFDNFLHGVSTEGYGTFAQEFQEIGNKTWLGGGEVKINKKTWYAHLHKGSKYGRMYPQSRSELITHINWSADYWMRNQWADRIHDISWLIEKFWPVPTWPEDRNLWVSPGDQI